MCPNAAGGPAIALLQFAPQEQGRDQLKTDAIPAAEGRVSIEKLNEDND
jgi:hypothetical protein